MAQHVRLTIQAGIEVYLCDPPPPAARLQREQQRPFRAVLRLGHRCGGAQPMGWPGMTKERGRKTPLLRPGTSRLDAGLLAGRKCVLVEEVGVQTEHALRRVVPVAEYRLVEDRRPGRQ